MGLSAYEDLGELKSPKEIIVNSLSEFIELVTNDNYKNSYFRGEPAPYDSIIASAFRTEYKGFGSNEEYPFLKMKEEYRREVWNSINEETKKNFLGFCQHHGLPTYLIDFSNSPLVSLYFACQNDRDNDSEYGYIYLIKNRCMNLLYETAKLALYVNNWIILNKSDTDRKRKQNV